MAVAESLAGGEESRRGRLIGVALVVLSSAAFGTSPVVGKLAYGDGVALGELLFFRFLVAGLLLVPLALAREPQVDPRQLLSRRAFLAGSLFSMQSLCFFLSLRTLRASVTELMLFSYPALVALAGWLFFGERLTRRGLVAIVATAAGTVLIIGDISVGFGAGLLLGIASPLAYTAYLFATRYAAVTLAPLWLSVATLICGLPLLAAVTTLLGYPPVPPTSSGAAIADLALIGGPLIGIPTLLAGIERIGVVRAAVISATEPVFTLIFAALLLGDVLPGLSVVGAALLLLAVPLATDGVRGDGSIPAP